MIGNITDILDHVGSWSALKWVVIVLVAGFIGQFGKMLASAIVRKINLARSKNRTDSIVKPQVSDENRPMPAVDMQKTISTPSGNQEYPDKKALKTMTKASKKAAKNSR
ncbi:MAG: hypothetical protein CVU43_18420 [Chloroflexi bacterium HGW-Chloroflexi-5]|jgi:hypothetical protein|nr:MAG: hypothetical protein CVU54_14095 [Deltaproteobacteria bacterium HGW-Deltaproteobacteria-12]PKN96895.1 MAG: hypothetical protein CVU43_18420 [Chloroflexi bacterium HGW-Chloroflexi-5]